MMENLAAEDLTESRQVERLESQAQDTSSEGVAVPVGVCASASTIVGTPRPEGSTAHSDSSQSRLGLVYTEICRSLAPGSSTRRFRPVSAHVVFYDCRSALFYTSSQCPHYSGIFHSFKGDTPWPLFILRGRTFQLCGDCQMHDSKQDTEPIRSKMHLAFRLHRSLCANDPPFRETRLGYILTLGIWSTLATIFQQASAASI
ncbi:uncharacterized protein EKO05_0008397 [Ascochyta rabiei]|uniref:uncharacterized protein n=1 Tax=Didymella rabiei TaxID=5454 RepID=UPI002205070D|nr:uncharacterized protein EKO05_0008397 [Ascochyta rabiei]UPX18080.1 hypothetical protein EKO05_0008397 [Ascochyta rabiei]